jgi:hypothetical protein
LEAHLHTEIGIIFSRSTRLVVKENGPWRRFILRGEVIQDTDERGGSEMIDVSLHMANRTEAIAFFKRLLAAAEACPPTRRGRPRE